MTNDFVNIHTHRPTGRGIELRTAGVHPWVADKEDVALLRVRLKVPKSDKTGADAVQAIGETGLDFACDTDRECQAEVFRAQLALACELDFPVVLHCVRAFEEVMRCLATCEPRAVIFHGFVGSPEQAAKAVARGYYLSFGERAFASPKTLAAMRQTPLAQLFLETDDSPTPIEEIYRRAATVLGIPVAELQQTALENYERIFCRLQLTEE